MVNYPDLNNTVSFICVEMYATWIHQNSLIFKSDVSDNYMQLKWGYAGKMMNKTDLRIEVIFKCCYIFLPAPKRWKSNSYDFYYRYKGNNSIISLLQNDFYSVDKWEFFRQGK